MELAGKVIAVLEKRSGTAKSTGNQWVVQEYVIETHDNYPRRLCFEVFGEDRINQFNIQIGEELNVSFDVDAREWQGRWFNSIRAWRVDRVSTPQPVQESPVAPPFAAPTAPAPTVPTADDKDDLPF